MIYVHGQLYVAMNKAAVCLKIDQLLFLPAVPPPRLGSGLILLEYQMIVKILAVELLMVF